MSRLSRFYEDKIVGEEYRSLTDAYAIGFRRHLEFKPGSAGRLHLLSGKNSNPAV